MLPSWFSAILPFLKTQWLPITCALVTLIIWEIIRRGLRKSSARVGDTSEDAFAILAQRDSALIAAAIARLDGADANRAAYVELLGFRLDFLVRKFKKSHDLSKQLGVAALCASSVSSFITGSSFFGHLTIGLSFTVTSIGTVALAIVTFLNADVDAINNLLLAERIRLEITQYVGGSSEYANLCSDESYLLFAATIDQLLLHHITIQEAESKARVAAKNATDNTGTTGECP
jgi:hypothetical protein